LIYDLDKKPLISSCQMLGGVQHIRTADFNQIDTWDYTCTLVHVCCVHVSKQ